MSESFLELFLHSFFIKDRLLLVRKVVDGGPKPLMFSLIFGMKINNYFSNYLDMVVHFYTLHPK